MLSSRPSKTHLNPLARSLVFGLLVAMVAACTHGQEQTEAIEEVNEPLAAVGLAVSAQDPIAPTVAFLMTQAGTCTGTLLKPGLILTAAHCVVGHEAEVRIVFGMGYLASEQRVELRGQAVRHEDLNIDLAVLRYPGATPAFMNQTVLPTSQAAEALKVGDEALLAAYRIGAEGRDEQLIPLQKARIRVKEIEGARVYLGAETSSRCLGDAGGPLYRSSEKGLVLVAVSRAFIERDNCKVGSIYTLIEPFQEWIAATAKNFDVAFDKQQKKGLTQSFYQVNDTGVCVDGAGLNPYELDGLENFHAGLCPDEIEVLGEKATYIGHATQLDSPLILNFYSKAVLADGTLRTIDAGTAAKKYDDFKVGRPKR